MSLYWVSDCGAACSTWCTVRQALGHWSLDARHCRVAGWPSAQLTVLLVCWYVAAASGYSRSYCLPSLRVSAQCTSLLLAETLSTVLTFSVITLSSSLILLRRVLTCCSFLPFSCCVLHNSHGELQHDALTLQLTDNAINYQSCQE